MSLKTYCPKSSTERRGYLEKKVHFTLNLSRSIMLKIIDPMGCLQMISIKTETFLEIINILSTDEAINLWKGVFDISWVDAKESIAYIKHEN